MNNSNIKQRFHNRLKDFHAEQHGAIALLVLAALLIMLMMSMVIYDTGQAARDKINLSAAADTAAWSQSAVEARSMNMIAFTNVAKRITIGMTSFYLALWIAYAELAAIALVVTIACWVADVFTFGALTAVCEKLSEFTYEVVEMMIEEAPDLATFADINTSYFLKDVTALDDYQNYMAELTPWWGWSEQLLRGIRNGALVTASFPAPPTAQVLPEGFNISGLISQSPHDDQLPAAKLDDYESSWENMCKRVSKLDGIISDNLINPADALIKSDCLNGWKKPIICAITAGLAALQVNKTCNTVQKNAYGKPGAPYELRDYPKASDWRLATSNLIFAYKDDAQRMDNEGARKKFGFLSRDYSTSPAQYVYKAGGYWAFARSEITFQHDGDAPNMWYPAWTARMRPVALSGDWTEDDTQMKNAWRDVAPYFVVAAGVSSLIDGNFDFGAMAADALRIEQAASGLNKSNVQGVSR